MNTKATAIVTPLLVLGTVLLAACNVSVRDGDGSGTAKEVDIRSPFGDLSVRAGETPDTGLPTYPGARPLLDNDRDVEGADVRIGSPLFGLNVAAAKFESDDEPGQVVAFYRNELKAFGEVTECRGEVDFKGRAGGRRPVCKERPSSREIQLIAGTEDEHRIVVVKPRGAGSELALVHLQIRG